MTLKVGRPHRKLKWKLNAQWRLLSNTVWKIYIYIVSEKKPKLRFLSRSAAHRKHANYIFLKMKVWTRAQSSVIILVVMRHSSERFISGWVLMDLHGAGFEACRPSSDNHFPTICTRLLGYKIIWRRKVLFVEGAGERILTGKRAHLNAHQRFVCLLKVCCPTNVPHRVFAHQRRYT